MSYRVTQYTRERAAEIGVSVRASTRTGKKIDVFRDGRLVASVGGAGYSDYPTYMQTHSKSYADERRRAFYARHAKSIAVVRSPAWYAAKLLW